MTVPNEWETRFMTENEDLLKLLVERSRFYREAGDGDMLLMMASALSGTAQVLLEIVKTEAVVVKTEGLTIEDCLGKKLIN